MVIAENRFLIDASFIVDQVRKTFLGSSLITVQGRDHTFLFGCVRDFLRLRLNLGIRACTIIVGEEAYSAISHNELSAFAVILGELGIPHVLDPQNSALNIIGDLRHDFTHIVTADETFLQFCTDLIVVMQRSTKKLEWDWVSSDVVKKRLGIVPAKIPTYLALADQSSSSVLTNTQAMRLVEIFGTIDSIFLNLEAVPSPIRKKLVVSESNIRQCYAKINYDPVGSLRRKIVQEYSLAALNSPNSRQTIIQYGFHSLLALLDEPIIVPPCMPDRKSHSDSYHTVTDSEQLRRLESVIFESDLCSFDTESDDKDPREASLLGISFSAKEGEAYFIPLIESDLKGLTRKDVLDSLNKIFGWAIRFVGHNSKYDCLLLRRSGINIPNVHFDTMLAAYECHGDWPFFNLSYLCKRYLGKEIESYSDLVSAGKTFFDLPLNDMANHACQDADITRRLYPLLMAQLQVRRIKKQFFRDTMPLIPRLVELELNGISIDTRRFQEIKNRLSEQIDRLKSEICMVADRDFNPEEHLELASILSQVADSQGYIGPRRLTVAALEHLAIIEPVARLAVRIKRVRTQITRLESISSAARDGRIRPLFNQIKSRTGVLTTSEPNIFDLKGVSDLRFCFDPIIQDLFVETKASLHLLADVTKDPILIKELSCAGCVGAVEVNDPMAKGLDFDEILLRLAVGQSDTTISKWLLVGRMATAKIRHDLQEKYEAMFRWLNDFRRLGMTRGFVTNGDLRKHIDGLKSSDVTRRGLASEYAVRWLIRFDPR